MILFLFLFDKNGYSQAYEPIGQHFLYNFSAKKYKSNPQNFDIIQSNNNLIYIANAGGLLEYDGETWRNIKIPTQQTFTLEKNEKGGIYVGALDNFGYLKTGENGVVEYYSLSDELKDQKVPTIREIIYHQDWVYFFPDKNIADNYLYAYSEKENEIHKIVSPFKINFEKKNNQKIILQLDNGELYSIKNKEIVSLSNDVKWKEIYITELVRIGELTLVYSGDEIYITDKQWNNPTVYENINLPDNLNEIIYFKNKLIATSKYGISIFDNTGQLIFPLNKNLGLIDNNINKIYIDSQENLWAATENGLSVIDVNNTLTFYNFSDGIDGTVVAISKYKNNIIAETKSGVFELKKSINIDENNAFEKLSAIVNSPYGVTSFLEDKDTTMLVADFDGILKRTGPNSFDRILSCAPWEITVSKSKQNRILIPDYTSGLIILEYENRKYTPHFIDDLNNISGRHVYEDTRGDYWLSHETNGIYHIVEKNSNRLSFDVTFFDQNSGLPEGYVFAFRFNNNLYFATEKGFYEFENGKFFRSKSLSLSFAKEYTVHRASVDLKGNLWVSAYDVNDIKKYFTGYGKIKDGQVNWIRKPFFKASEEKIDVFYHEDEFISWFGGPDGLFRFDKRNPENFNRKYKLLLRKITVNEDQILYGGSGDFNMEMTFPFGENKYYFEFSATHFKTENGVKYAYLLEGQDKEWSKFSTNNSIDFRNLYEGNYTLRVKAIDDFGNGSEEFSLHFTILPPFYRTTWAYLLYFIVFVLIIIGAVRISSNGLKKIIRQRTKEIEEQKHIVEEKNKEIIDSISYAKRLQQAILPSQKSIQENLPENFILYKPKDIVAGDFYWMEKVGDWVLFAVCDCTGHGVPGAMVSVVGANSLNRCVNEFKLTEPAAILDRLTLLVEETFSKSEGEVRDGMDMSLCAFNKKTLEIKWAGANNPIWFVRNGEINEIKGDKQPIGKYENRKPFKQHTIQLEKGDKVYLFTDGYADQFGGEKGKKFKYSQLKDAILLHHQKAIRSQHDILDEIFESWRSHMEQTDDVCLWGISL